MKKLIVDKKYNNKKLNTFLLDTFPHLNTNTLYKYLRKKDILVNGLRINSNVSLNSGDEIVVYIPDLYLETTINNSDIIYEDNNILILNKPTRNRSYWKTFFKQYIKTKIYFYRTLS